MLLPITKLKNLDSKDARPLASDPVVDAVLAIKHAPQVTESHLEALEALGPVNVSLVVTQADWTAESFPVLTYAVEEWHFLETYDVPEHLYRYADSDEGAWWAPQWINARMHGRGFHSNPQMWKVRSSERQVLARMRTRFHTTYSPAEFIAISG